MDRRDEEQSKRSTRGYGSSYRKGGAAPDNEAITSVLGGTTWRIKPDLRAKAKKPCVWMGAGALPFKNCNHHADCPTCSFDHGMQAKVNKGTQMSWQTTMRLQPGLQRTCRHSLTGRIGLRACAYDFNCARCDFDQLLEDVWAPRTASPVGEIQPVRGFAMPLDFHFHSGHAWIRPEDGGFLRVGLDDFALKLFGPSDRLDLPLTGKPLDRGRPGWAMKRENHWAEVLAPMDGVVVEVNPRVRERPGLANCDPYGAGWLFTLHAAESARLPKDLLAGVESLGWLETEVSWLEGMIEEVAGPLTADGGYLAGDIYGQLPRLDWNRLARTFLKT